MSKLNEDVARCFGRLRHSEFAPLLEFMKAQYQETVDSLIVADPEVVKMLQGKARLLKDYISYIEENEKLVLKFKATRPYP
jgi:hypothetical protein